ncbi:MAG TPA: PD-(D/E)XK nuclease family protein, partial [Candidatus Limnocylindria bacterium]|nr:PD-(D/E)XK nuclease family protein [Candidatus Limnocylindria bacterium]
ETWAACPVKWLVERHLDPGALEPDAEPLARGALVHEVLEATLVRLREATGSARVTVATLPEARRLAAEELQARCGAFPLSGHEPTARASLRRLLREIERYLAFEAEAGGSWEPLHLEWRFGFEDEADGPPPLRLGDGAVTVRGVIDRIDVDASGTRAVVRDYKTGAVHPVAAWERDVRLQIALYLLAVRRLLGLEVVAGVYQPLRRADLRGRGIVLEGPGEEALGPGGFVPTDVQGAEDFEERLAWAEEHAVALAGELRAGALVPHPERCSSRGGCSYPGICRSVDS